MAEREERGRLKIFFGAAPGVGKTFAMLQAGVTAKAEGRDVVAGLVETHGRAETAALIGRAGDPRAPACPAPGPHRRGVRPRRRAGPEAGPAAGRRTRPHERAGQPPSQAVAGRRGAAGRRHRRLDHAERPASREPQRRRPADHRRPRARDGARRGLRERRRDRPGRPPAGRAAEAAGRGQGLSAARRPAGRATISSSRRT